MDHIKQTDSNLKLYFRLNDCHKNLELHPDSTLICCWSASVTSRYSCSHIWSPMPRSPLPEFRILAFSPFENFDRRILLDRDRNLWRHCAWIVMRRNFPDGWLLSTGGSENSFCNLFPFLTNLHPLWPKQITRPDNKHLFLIHTLTNIIRLGFFWFHKKHRHIIN